MVPISGLDDVKVAWIALKKEGFIIYGFLLYTDTDRVLVDYMSDGIIELDYLSGEDCAVFVIESPSEKWISYSQKNNHTWWKIFGKKLVEQVNDQIQTEMKPKSFWDKLTVFNKIIIQNNSSSTVVVGDGNVVSLSHIIQPKLALIYNRAEAIKVANHFRVKANELPCLIFFKDLDERIVWKKTISDEEYSSQIEVKKFFRDFFGSVEFKELLETNLF